MWPQAHSSIIKTQQYPRTNHVSSFPQTLRTSSSTSPEFDFWNLSNNPDQLHPPESPHRRRALRRRRPPNPSPAQPRTRIQARTRNPTTSRIPHLLFEPFLSSNRFEEMEGYFQEKKRTVLRSPFSVQRGFRLQFIALLGLWLL